QEIQPDPTLQDAPQVPEAVALAPRIIPQRLQRLKEDVRRFEVSLGEQSELLERIHSDQARFSMVDRVTQLIE
ncbi:hypothetical protein Tco_0288796, partial [Tanacetum coccineum]